MMWGGETCLKEKHVAGHALNGEDQKGVEKEARPILLFTLEFLCSIAQDLQLFRQSGEKWWERRWG